MECLIDEVYKDKDHYTKQAINQVRKQYIHVDLLLTKMCIFCYMIKIIIHSYYIAISLAI